MENILYNILISPKKKADKPKPKDAWKIVGTDTKEDDLEKRDAELTAEMSKLEARIEDIKTERCTIAGMLKKPMPRFNNRNNNNNNQKKQN